MKRYLMNLSVAGALLAAASTMAADESGFQQLFNGKDLAGWTGNPELWSVKDGAILGRTTPEKTTKGNTFLIWTNGDVADFEFRCSYRIKPGDDKGFANSGVQYRSKVFDPANWVVGGYQADMEAGSTYSGILYEERMSRGIMAERGQKVIWDKDGKKQVVGTLGDSAAIQSIIRKGDWNEYVIIAKGNHLQHFINGRPTVDVTDETPGKQAKSGVLALQLHAGPPMSIEFKNIRLKNLGGGTKVVLIAGPQSHGPGEHEHRAGCLLLKKCLDEGAPGVTSAVYSNGWPKDAEAAFKDASTILIYSDGGGGHPFLQGDRLQILDKKMKEGVGMVAIHYAVEPTIEKGQEEFLDWIGGAFEIHHSVNPHWLAEFKELPKHPITQGVNPFKMQDEWYFFMRFRDGMKGVTPILSAVAPESTMRRSDGPHEGNPEVRASVKRGDKQHMAWAAERDDGGRGFGFTGAHFHKNWANDDFRKLVLNAILWTAKADVPPAGVASVVTPEDLKQNLDKK